MIKLIKRFYWYIKSEIAYRKKLRRIKKQDPFIYK